MRGWRPGGDKLPASEASAARANWKNKEEYARMRMVVNVKGGSSLLKSFQSWRCSPRPPLSTDVLVSCDMNGRDVSKWSVTIY